MPSVTDIVDPTGLDGHVAASIEALLGDALGSPWASAITAHQGGWDEFLFVAAPIAVVIGLLRVAGIRSKRIQREREGGDDVTR